jgi:hypothetical protein
MNKFYTSEKISENIEETPEGFLICKNVPIARIGSQTYKADEVPIEPNRDGLVEIRRTEEEVFKPEVLQSFEGKPFTIDHPDEMVTPENWKDLAHGFVTNIRRGTKEKANLIIGDVIATTKKVIELIQNGMRQISCGYDADYEQIRPGLGIQKNIIGNHIALVMRGRAGHRCAIGDKQYTNCGEYKCDHENKIEEDEDAMRFKDKLKGTYRRLFKDDDFKQMSESEKADKLADVTSNTIEEEIDNISPEMLESKEDKPMKDDDLERENLTEEGSSNDDEPKMESSNGNGDITVADLNEKIDRLIGIIEAFVKSAASITGDEDISDPMPNEGEESVNDEDEEGKTIKPDEESETPDNEDEEDLDQKEERERAEARDCDSIWHDIAYRADLLYPGIRISKPTKNHRKTLDSIKRRALKKSFVTDAEAVSVYVKPDKVDRLSGEALNIAFMAASEAIKSKNNRAVRDSVVINTKAVTNDIRSIQERNKQFWGKK